jgi:hypothetical protein
MMTGHAFVGSTIHMAIKELIEIIARPGAAIEMRPPICLNR